MKTAFSLAAFLCASLASAATPINGLYSTLSAGYTYTPNNLSMTHQGLVRTDAHYQYGYNAGGSFGYKSNPLRYEGELTYIDSQLDGFRINSTKQTGVRGQNNVVLAMANVFYDLPTLIEPLQPYLGVGLGYSWIKAKFQSAGPNVGATLSDLSNSAFAYQAAAGLTLNFAENYALAFGYRYIATERTNALGKAFQAHLGNLTAIYRFDGQRYK